MSIRYVRRCQCSLQRQIQISPGPPPCKRLHNYIKEGQNNPRVGRGYKELALTATAPIGITQN